MIARAFDARRVLVGEPLDGDGGFHLHRAVGRQIMGGTTHVGTAGSAPDQPASPMAIAPLSSDTPKRYRCRRRASPAGSALDYLCPAPASPPSPPGPPHPTGTTTCLRESRAPSKRC